MNRIYRHSHLWGPNGLLGVGKSKYFKDFIIRPGAGELIPGTTVKRMRTIKLGTQARGIPESEVQRVTAALSRGEERQRQARR